MILASQNVQIAEEKDFVREKISGIFFVNATQRTKQPCRVAFSSVCTLCPLARHRERRDIFARRANTWVATPLCEGVLSLWLGGATRFELRPTSEAPWGPVHMPLPKVGELAHQTQGVGIFAKGEYLGGAGKH